MASRTLPQAQREFLAELRKESETTLPTVETVVCSICIEEIQANDKGSLLVTTCGHLFHEDCINGWFGTRTQSVGATTHQTHACPICHKQFKRGRCIRVFVQMDVGRPTEKDNFNLKLDKMEKYLEDSFSEASQAKQEAITAQRETRNAKEYVRNAKEELMVLRNQASYFAEELDDAREGADELQNELGEREEEVAELKRQLKKAREEAVKNAEELKKKLRVARKKLSDLRKYVQLSEKDAEKCRVSIGRLRQNFDAACISDELESDKSETDSSDDW